MASRVDDGPERAADAPEELARRPPGPVDDPPVHGPVADFGEDGLDRQLRHARRRDRRWQLRALVLLVDVAALALPAGLVQERTTSAVAYVVLALAVLGLTGAYRLRISLSALEEAPQLLTPLAVALLLVGPPVLARGAATDLAVHAAASVPALLAGRGLSYAAIRWARRRGLVEEPTLVLGGGRLGMELLATLFEHPEYGLRAVGFLDTAAGLDGRRPIGAFADIETILDDYGVRRVVVAFGTTREAELVSLIRSAALRDVEIHVVPRFFDLGTVPAGRDVDDLWGIPLYRVRRAALRRTSWRAKRLLDVVVAGTALVLLSPLLAALALAVRLSSPGPVLFRQPRTGQSGRDFDVLKLRTLRVAPAAPPGAAAPADGAASTSATMGARREDVERRRTAVGSFLRRTSLDELPQLWNVLRGDMSLVGPRPEETSYASRFRTSVHGYEDRHRLAVGLTGWAQVHGLRGDTSIEERARFDNHYIEHWSLWRDVTILLRTLTAVVRQAVRDPDRPSRSSAPPDRA